MEYSDIYKRSNEIQIAYEEGAIDRIAAIELLNTLKAEAAAAGKIFEFDESDLVDDSVETGDDYYEESEEYEQSEEYSDDYDEDE